MFAEADGEILFELGEVLGSVVEELGLTTGFQPEVGDACFAHSVDDDSWYRGVVRNRNQDGTFTVRMIDFGNEVRITITVLIGHNDWPLSTGLSQLWTVRLLFSKDFS